MKLKSLKEIFKPGNILYFKQVPYAISGTKLTKELEDIIVAAPLAVGAAGLYAMNNSESKEASYAKQGTKLQYGGQTPQFFNQSVKTMQPIKIIEKSPEEFLLDRDNILLNLPQRGWQLEEFDQDLNNLAYRGKIKFGEIDTKSRHALQRKYNLSSNKLDQTIDELALLGYAKAMTYDLSPEEYIAPAEDNILFKKGGNLRYFEN